RDREPAAAGAGGCRVAGDRAVVQRATARPAAALFPSIVGCEGAVAQCAQDRPAAAVRSRIAAERAVAQRATLRPASVRSRVAGHHTVGDDRAGGFAPHTTATLLALAIA